MAQSKVTSEVTVEQAQLNAAAVRRLWKTGRASQAHLDKLKPQAVAYGHKDKTLKQEAERLGINYDTASKARRLAELYTREEVEALCRQIEKHRSRFAASHFLLLLRVEDRAERDQMARQAIRKSWSHAHLLRIIQAAHGRRRPDAGRRPGVPRDETERLLAIDALCAKWIRYEAACDKLPKSLAQPMSKVTSAVRRVQAAIAAKLKSPRAGRQRRSRP